MNGGVWRVGLGRGPRAGPFRRTANAQSVRSDPGPLMRLLGWLAVEESVRYRCTLPSPPCFPGFPRLCLTALPERLS